MSVDETSPLVASVNPLRRRTNNLLVLVVALVVLGLCLTRDPQVRPATVHLDVSDVFCDAAAQASGYIQLPKKTDDHYFYWFFASRDQPNTDPLILWLTGGPGASSLLALLTENGPCVVGADANSTTSNPYSWTNNASVLWVDQPTGTGFSYGAPGDFDRTEDDVGANMYAFLQRWLQANPTYIGRPFFITGESYSGQYIPVIASTILDRQATVNNATQRNDDDDVMINLQGIALGNAIVSQQVQFQHQLDLFYENAYNLTLLNASSLASYEHNLASFIQWTAQCSQLQNVTACHELTSESVRAILLGPIVLEAKVNPYDMRQPSILTPDGGIPDDILATPTTDNVKRFLNQPHVRARLGLSDASPSWAITSPDVSRHLRFDATRDYEAIVASLLHRHVRVLVYAGDADLICNWRGCEAWTLHMRWAGQNVFASAIERPFALANEVKGAVRSAQNLTFLRVFNSGHMVPSNQPEATLTMIQRFVRNEPL
ncbi:Aste57867_8544 [Aphanomyces stellatus]|uniref:Aste57867_8544 protein n=1 Tax=Aphanomyces stellatus TaxID=120398 RepID=A0A485KKN0_9STRA|nr:hypothetical protein As57867_008512 [Aphanomyces stellatus]VFT85430.1 Aste57867_8544 [Aphanomyces stellatus]